VLSRGGAFLVAIFIVATWSVLFVYAMLREPRSGHSLVVVATLSFPAIVVGVKAGLIPFEALPIAEIVPLSAIGIAVLTTGLVRAHQRTLREGERTAQALAARERAEAELRAVNESLEQRVAQRTGHLEETIAGLESFNRSVSHDLRGPLGGISGVARIARDKLGEGLLDEADAMMAVIARQADESVAMVAALLELARVGNAQPQRAHVDATALAGEVVATLQAAGKTASADVVVQPLPAADADRELLRQVFANLVGNACKFAGAGNAARVEVGAEATPQGPAYFVRDNGIGFAPADAARLFRPFERLHGQRYEGFGVGLSIVQRIVDHHGGRVWAEGMPGRGATFWFTLGRG
jgi:signal transduction histidine kinase